MHNPVGNSQLNHVFDSEAHEVTPPRQWFLEDTEEDWGLVSLLAATARSFSHCCSRLNQKEIKTHGT